MATLYWITVLGNISALAGVVFAISIGILFFSILRSFDGDTIKPNKKIFKISLIGIFVSLAIGILVPSKNELYAIYGVGSVLDYAKSSKEVQKLPDNAVKALNAYLENIQKKDSKDSEQR